MGGGIGWGQRREVVGVGAATVGVAAALLVVLAACGVDSGQQAMHPRSAKPAADFVMQANDFRNLHSMTKVRGFFIANRLGHLAAALRVVNSPRGGVYPVGTIIQLVPQEAMVKRRRGYNPATHDWEFFSLRTTGQGTEVLARGRNVVNRFGGNCASCHSAAQPRFDFVCEHTHGCAPLPIGDDVVAAIQAADPRPTLPGG